MATSKTLTPTNQTISIPALGDAPDASVFSNCIEKEADAINTLNSQLIPTAITGAGDFNTYAGTGDGKTTLYSGANIAQMSNRPSTLGSSQWPFILHVRQIGGYIQQILFTYSTTDSPANVFFRNQTYVSGAKAWASWVQMIANSDSGLQSIDLSSSSFVRYRKIGNIVHVSVKYDPTVDGGMNQWQNKQIGTLPVGYRPCFDMCVRAVPDRVNASTYASVTVNGGGGVFINSRNTAIDQSAGNVIYGWLAFAAVP